MSNNFDESMGNMPGCRNLIGAMIVAIILILLILFSSCSPQKQLTRICNNNPELCNSTDTVTKTTVKFKRYDSLIFTPKDSSFIRAYFRCDSLGRVRLQLLNKVLGERSSVRLVTKYDSVVKDSVILIQAECDELRDSITWYVMELEQLRTVNNTYQTECPECFISMKLAKWLGSILFVMAFLLWQHKRYVRDMRKIV